MELALSTQEPVNPLFVYAPITGPLKVSMVMRVSLILPDGNVLRMKKSGWICMGKISFDATGDEAFPGYLEMIERMRKNLDRTVKYWKSTTPDYRKKFHFDFEILNQGAAPPGTALGYYEIDDRWTEL